MKGKILLFVLIGCITMTQFSCNSTNKDEEDINRIFAVDEEMNATEEEITEKNLISVSPVSSIDINVPAAKTIRILNKEYSLIYQETLCYPLNKKVVDKYSISGTDRDYVSLYKDGTIESLSFAFATLEITENEQPENVKTLLESVLGEIINVSKYQYVDIPEYVENADGFGSYYFMYYNATDGYITDFSRVYVYDDGTVRYFVNNDLGIEDIEFKIDKEKEERLIELKLKQLFTDGEIKYKSHNDIFSSQAVVCNDELYIQYSVSANYTDASRKEQTSYLQRILVPVSMLE